MSTPIPAGVHSDGAFPSPTAVGAEAAAGAQAVVDGYTARARFALAEAHHVHQPPVLAGLLAHAQHVLEIPCAGGHFLAAYATAGVRVTLADANPAMLAVATIHAQEVGLAADQVETVHCLLPEVPPVAGVDLVVVPNAAINQLLVCCELTALLAGLAAAAPGARLLLQVVTVAADGRPDRCGCYDPTRPDGCWEVDRSFDPGRAGGATARWRHQRRRGNTLQIRFDYRDEDGDSLHTSTVTLHLLGRSNMLTDCTTAGLSDIEVHPDPGGPTQLVAALPEGRP
ncbi:MAG: hypothetical protein HKP61_18600 [Dactylosporangium sp.]|nr:hypothetical protein [Dactylosporangium sp.]NNJ62900.1 hypothetical protein [Dactylosporangium sp.]